MFLASTIYYSNYTLKYLPTLKLDGDTKIRYGKMNEEGYEKKIYWSMIMRPQFLTDWIKIFLLWLIGININNLELDQFPLSK